MRHHTPEPVPPAPALIVRQEEPANLESPFAALDDFLTPTRLFYVRSHFAVPEVNAALWRLRVEGAVARPLEIGYEELRQWPAHEAPTTLECAGNSRASLEPKVRGVQWTSGAVSNARWRGVPLANVLARAGVQPGAGEVIFEGADHGEIDDDLLPPGEISYAYSVPLARAQNGGVLLAYAMNGEPLTPPHGYPVRVVVPGYYGMASVKWLSRIVVSETPFRGYFNTLDYAAWREQDGLLVREPLSEMSVKSLIARPAAGEVVSPRIWYPVRGAAWTGDAEVVKVEVSTDGGREWAEAHFVDTPVRHAWRRWIYEWHTPATPGIHRLLCRATDARGCTQPMAHDQRNGTHVINHVMLVTAEVQ